MTMSTELATILANNPMIIQSGVDEDTAALAGGSLNQTKRLSIKGGVFRKMVGGKEVGSIEDRHMNIIFVRAAHSASRQCYEGTYEEGKVASPICWSNDSVKPDTDVEQPCAPSCDVCPNSAKGSNDSGVGAKCKLSWRTAVVLPQDPSGDVLEFVIPAASSFGKEENGRWPFKSYGAMVASNNISLNRLVTKVQFDTKVQFPKVLFSPSGAVDPNDYETISKQGKAPAAESAIKLTVYKKKATQEGEAAPEVEAPEPVVRESAKKPTTQATDATDVIKKWTKK
jgi:hypothetical protein